MKFSNRSVTHKVRARSVHLVIVIACVGSAAASAQAQTATAPFAGASAPSEALRRQAEGPYRFILQHGGAVTVPIAKPVVGRTTPGAPSARPPDSGIREIATPISSVGIARGTPAPPLAAPDASSARPVVATPATADPPPADAAPSGVLASLPPTLPAVPAPTALAAIDIVLRPIEQGQPQINARLRREIQSAVVKVAFAVNPDGSVADARVLRSSNRALDAPTLAAVSAWRYAPVAIRVDTEVEMAFRFE